MAKVWNTKKHIIEWEDDILCAVEDAYWEVEEILYSITKSQIVDHDDLVWLAEVKVRLKDLVDTLAKRDYDIDDQINNR